jgi:hypothetical protein
MLTEIFPVSHVTNCLFLGGSPKVEGHCGPWRGGGGARGRGAGRLTIAELGEALGGDEVLAEQAMAALQAEGLVSAGGIVQLELGETHTHRERERERARARARGALARLLLMRCARACVHTACQCSAVTAAAAAAEGARLAGTLAPLELGGGAAIACAEAVGRARYSNLYALLRDHLVRTRTRTHAHAARNPCPLPPCLLSREREHACIIHSVHAH